MADATPYLFFDGECRRAMEFYRSCFGGELHVTTYAEASTGANGEEDATSAPRDRVMHASLTRGSFRLMASDVPNPPLRRGDDVHVSVNCGSEEEISRVFAAVGAGGTVDLALHDAFWGALFGMLTDRFGVHWMFVFDRSRNPSRRVGPGDGADAAEALHAGGVADGARRVAHADAVRSRF